MRVRVLTEYLVYNHSGTGIRHHYVGVEPNPNIFRTGVDWVNYEPHQPIITHTAPGEETATLPDGQHVHFAFMSIVGNIDGNHLYTDSGSRVVTVGAVWVNILIVYVPPGGIGLIDGGPGVWVDAFNVNTGQLSDIPVFMQVFKPPPPADSLDINSTTEANAEGEISTVTAKNMRADLSIDGLFFLKWKQIIPVEAIVSSRDVSLAKNESGEIWFAFYQGFKDDPVPTPVPYGNMIEIAEGVWINMGQNVLFGSAEPRPPVDILSALPAKLLTTVAILSLSSNMSEEVKADAINLAASHLNSVAESIKKNGKKMMQ